MRESQDADTAVVKATAACQQQLETLDVLQLQLRGLEQLQAALQETWSRLSSLDTQVAQIEQTMDTIERVCDAHDLQRQRKQLLDKVDAHRAHQAYVRAPLGLRRRWCVRAGAAAGGSSPNASLAAHSNELRRTRDRLERARQAKEQRERARELEILGNKQRVYEVQFQTQLQQYKSQHAGELRSHR